MTTTTSKDVSRTCFACLIFAGGAIASSTAVCEEPQTSEQVVIQAERPTSEVVGRSSIGAPIVLYQLQYHVSYADLDLATSAGADALRRRVHEVSASACADLDKLYPLEQPDPLCARKAEAGAMSQVDQAIKLAQAEGTSRMR